MQEKSNKYTPIRIKFLVCITGLILLESCSNKSKPSARTGSMAADDKYRVVLNLTGTSFTPDHSNDVSIICSLTNLTDSMLVIDMDTIMNVLKVYGQGATQKYPMYILYSLPPDYDSGEVLYIDPKKTEVLFTGPLQQLFFGQLRFNNKEEFGWMWKSTVDQKANLSPAHDYASLQPEAKFWFTLRMGGKTYTSNTEKIIITSPIK
jgi:hypothetical protein